MEGVGRLSEDADGFGPANVCRIGVAIERKDVGDPIHHRHERDHVARVRLGDEKFQPGGVGLTSADEPVPLRRLGTLFSGFRDPPR